MHTTESLPLDRESRRRFLRAASLAVGAAAMAGATTRRAPAQSADAAGASESDTGSSEDRQRMRALAAWTARSFDTPAPNVFGASIYATASGERVARELNKVGAHHDPSAHGEVEAIRAACDRLQSGSLRGYTLYTTCEPCPMCMACALWAGLDRVVYGATIEDAAQYMHQIRIPATEVARRYDVPCLVDGPVEHGLCLALFTDPRMQAQFARWKR